MLRLMTCLLTLVLCGPQLFAQDEDETGLEVKALRPNAAATGKLHGRFLFDGEPPPRAPLDVTTVRRTQTGEVYSDRDSERFAKLNIADESLKVGPDRGIQNVLIWVSDKSIPIPPVPLVRRLPQPAVLTFQGGRLQPHVLAWWADHRVLQLVNEDTSAMNLQWDGLSTSGFNQLLAPNTSVTLAIKPDRLPTKVKSSIYPWLQQAILFPCAHPYFAVTDTEGFFTISDLPAGQWEFRAWHERCGWIKTADWPKGKFTVVINEGETELGTIKILPAALQPKGDLQARTAPIAVPQEKRPPQPAVEVRGWKTLAESRRTAHDRDTASEWVGKWELRLPAGFHYPVTLGKTDDGLLKLGCESNLTLLGTFAFSKNQLQLVKPNDDGIDDFVWQLNDEGNFVLITDRNRVGARYIGAVLERTK